MEESGASEPLRRAASAYRDAYVAAHDAQGVAGPAAQARADTLRAQLQQFSILSSDNAFRCVHIGTGLASQSSPSRHLGLAWFMYSHKCNYIEQNQK